MIRVLAHKVMHLETHGIHDQRVRPTGNMSAFHPAIIYLQISGIRHKIELPNAGEIHSFVLR